MNCHQKYVSRIVKALRRIVQKSDKSGVTMTEMVVAASIFLMVSASFTAAMLTAMRTQYMATDYYNAMNLARNRVQQARTKDWGSLGDLSETSIRVDSTGVTNSTGRYLRSTILSNVTPTCVAVEVRVIFASKANTFTDKPVTVQTLINSDML